jgi:PAS domain S-box-containing protein
MLQNPWLYPIALAFAVGITYFSAAQLSLALFAEPGGVALFWPAAGISSGVLIALGRSARLPVIGGAMVATMAANLMSNRNAWGAVAFALCDAGEAMFAAWLIERHYGSDFNLDKLHNVLGLLVAAVAATAASGIGGTVAISLFYTPTAPIWIIWQSWFAAGTVGMIAVAPLVVGLFKALREPPPRNEALDGVVALMVLAVMTAIIASLPPEPWGPLATVAMLFPILLWITSRCEPVFAAAAAFITSIAIMLTIAFGIGHYGHSVIPIGDRILRAQAAILGFSLCAYVLAALFAERRQHVRMLKEGQALLLEALAAGAVMVFECDFLSGQVRYSENAARLLGFDPQQTFTSPQFLAQIHPEDLAQFKAHHDRTRVDRHADTFTFRFIRPDGPEVWLEKISTAEFDTTGRLVRLKGLIRDITRSKQAEKRQDLLSAELDHRVKNVLARVAAVVRHTRRASGDQFVQSLNGRIQSMAAAHSLLSQSRGSSAGLADLIRLQLAPYATDTNIAISGPEVMLTAAETQAVAMVIHELVTNAAKHGALSSPNGRVSVNWDRSGAGATTILTITWRELGGRPPIATAVQPGYGTSLIRDLIPHELGGTVELTFPSGGAVCKIEFPIGRM